MKNTLIALALFVGAFSVSSVSAQSKEIKNVEVVEQETTANFQVSGKCNMCKNRIETAVRELEGVKAASWDVKTKTLSVSYDTTKLKESVIHQKVASVGHDTEKVKAKDEVYNKLPGCCKYERV